MKNKGFTLIELLVVVLIIGILAAIALPQYRLAVGKAEFSTLKGLTKSLQQSVQRYYLLNNTYDGLDTSTGRQSLDIELPAGSNCLIWTDNSNMIRCCKNIAEDHVCYYVKRDIGKPRYCLTNNATNKNSISHRICKSETGDQEGNQFSGSLAWWYTYR